MKAGKVMFSRLEITLMPLGHTTRENIARRELDLLRRL
jgi:hypothetical protein